MEGLNVITHLCKILELIFRSLRINVTELAYLIPSNISLELMVIEALSGISEHLSEFLKV